jgi:hypothetical protein
VTVLNDGHGRGLYKCPEGFFQTTDIVIDQALFSKVFGARYAHQGQHRVHFLQIEYLAQINAKRNRNETLSTTAKVNQTNQTHHSIAQPDDTGALAVIG